MGLACGSSRLQPVTQLTSQIYSVVAIVAQYVCCCMLRAHAVAAADTGAMVASTEKHWKVSWRSGCSRL